MNPGIDINKDCSNFLSKLNSTSDIDQQQQMIARPSNLQSVLTLVTQNTQVRTLAMVPQLEEYWQAVWASFGSKTQHFFTDSPDQDFKFMPIEKIHPLELIISFKIFLQYHKELLSNPNSNNKQLLLTAAKSGCIQAQQKVNNLALETTNPPLKELLINQAIEQTSQLIDSHGSYAAMMLANLHLKAYIDNPVQGNKESLVKSLHLAKFYEDCSDNAIHNASFGKGLSASNAFSIGNIDDAFELLKSYDNNISGSQVNSHRINLP